MLTLKNVFPSVEVTLPKLAETFVPSSKNLVYVEVTLPILVLFAPCTTPTDGGTTIASFVLVSPDAKLLTTWKSNTSLYAPPLHPSLNDSGALVQLVILTATSLFFALLLTLYPLPA